MLPIQTRHGLMRLTRLLNMNEVRSTADSREGESVAKPAHIKEHRWERERMGWLETECPEVRAHEPRRPVLVLEGAGQDSESP